MGATDKSADVGGEGSTLAPERADRHSDRVPSFPYREIRSARWPHGLPDRSDDTVLEAFDDAWLLVEHHADGADLVGLAGDYAAARAWLDGGPTPGTS